MDITALKVRDMRNMLDKKEISAAELTDAYLKRINDTDGKLESYITVTADEAEKAAAEAQKVIDRGEAKPLTGIPLAIKDNICTDGVKTTCASKMLENFVPPYNATVMEKLNAENIVMLGKTSMDEFAMGGSTQTSAFKKTKNPYDLNRVPGGSSGGSAAAVGAS
ncbi:MAG: Asp-tRNA(Asn)/Glu-tRNA(Gln) amidotransferase subunit GatA, partial [Oscillospiraceae bacterium]|nr:Asp-tRNA(Asn)/Glu-tRNA(Gln) amidotransferase subunit GatA [Oscillospiraceae bacterium]